MTTTNITITKETKTEKAITDTTRTDTSRPDTIISDFKFNEEWHLLNHPFYQAWSSGKLSLPILRDYSTQYAHHVRAFPDYLKKSISLAKSKGHRELLEENLRDEEGGHDGLPHPVLWENFAEGLGVSRCELEKSCPRLPIQNVVRVMTSYCQKSLAEALGALYAYEAQVPEIAHAKIEGLQKFYQVNDKKTLAFFEVHKIADVFHRDSLKQVIESLSMSEQQLAQQAADHVCRVLWDFLSEMHETHGLSCA